MCCDCTLPAMVIVVSNSLSVVAQWHRVYSQILGVHVFLSAPSQPVSKAGISCTDAAPAVSSGEVRVHSAPVHADSGDSCAQHTGRHIFHVNTKHVHVHAKCHSVVHVYVVLIV